MGSPALDAGDNTNAPATDQRGVARPFDGNQDGNAACDIGAYESIPDLMGAWGTLTQTATADQKVIFYGGVFARTQMSNSLNGTFSAQNQEAAAAPSSTIRFFLSDNATWDEEDTLLQEVASGTVNGGAARNVNLNVNLPANTNAAGKFVIAVVDATNGVAESNEGNNVTASAAIVEASRTVQQRPTAKPAKRKNRSRSK